MSQSITISTKAILRQVKISCQIPSIIEQIVTHKIIISAAADADITVTPEELQQAADNIRFMIKLRTTDETWAWLQKNSLSVDDFEEMIFINVISKKLAKYLFGERVEPWFFEHQLDYAGAAIYEIIFDDQDLAMELFFELQKGEISFPEVAYQYIQQKELRRIGGYQGIVSHKEMKPEISAAVFAAQPPQILKPIVTSKGIHLIFVEELIQPQLDEQLHDRILFDLFGDWVKQKMEEVEVLRSID